jgi:hypothetical protein
MKTIIIAMSALIIPSLAFAAGKGHVPTNGEECVECHTDQEQVWLNGKHGLMNVKCVVCHGSPEENFYPSPGLNRCRGCHGEAVADVEKGFPAKERSCFLCHEHHTVAVKEAARNRTGFHAHGGAK